MSRLPRNEFHVRLTKGSRGTWVQTERVAHEAWARLATRAPKAAAVMHLLVARMGPNNLVRANQSELAKTVGCSRSTIQEALYRRRDMKWIHIEEVESGAQRVYVVNARFAWFGTRVPMTACLFAAPMDLMEKDIVRKGPGTPKSTGTEGSIGIRIRP